MSPLGLIFWFCFPFDPDTIEERALVRRPLPMEDRNFSGTNFEILEADFSRRAPNNVITIQSTLKIEF